MLKILLILFQFCWFAPLLGQFSVVINVGNLPPEPRGYDLYIAGSSNGWNPSDDKFKFQRKGNGQFYIELKLAAGRYEYKITRGGWDKVECSKKGTPVGNRQIIISADTSFTIDIEEWQDNFKAGSKKSTASKNVKIPDTAFRIPQLNRTRRIWVYLPETYNNGQNLRYPVLYMHDGQNVFEDSTSFAGEWGVDEFLDSSRLKQCIVVAIDNGAGKRLNEYCPYDFNVKIAGTNTMAGKGEGGPYIDFLVNSLKPFIDKNYRTKKDRASTFIAGSSMGGLISLYAVLKYPKVFGGAGVFSPAFWVAPKIYDDIKAKGGKVKANIFFYAGKQESETMEPDMLRAAELMRKVSKSKIKIVVKENGKHNEPTWREIFPGGYYWLVNRR